MRGDHVPNAQEKNPQEEAFDEGQEARQGNGEHGQPFDPGRIMVRARGRGFDGRPTNCLPSDGISAHIV